jgi:hypothetical protein
MRKYDAWGQYRNDTAPLSNEPKLGFTGHQYDPETGLVYARARYYDPDLGRSSAGTRSRVTSGTRRVFTGMPMAGATRCGTGTGPATRARKPRLPLPQARTSAPPPR